MNWMGGARNRVKFHDERKAQQEFFERQRRKVLTNHSKSNKKKQSQDLLALHTVGRVHSPFPVRQSNKKSIRKLDFEKFLSCTRQIEEVDLGPCSPNTISSKICLNEAKDGHLNSSQKAGPHDSLIQTIGGTEQKTSQELLCQQGTVVNKLEEKETSKRLYLNSPQPFKFSQPQSAAECKQKLLVSEDFSTTPLVRYHQKKTIGEHASKRHKSHHRDLPGKRNRQIEGMSGTFEESVLGSYSTSTPISLPFQQFSFNKVKHSTTIDYLSPIMKESDVTETDFVFKPRPMVAELHQNSFKGVTSYSSTEIQPFTSTSIEDPYGRSKPFYATKITADGDRKSFLMEDQYKTPIKSGSDLLDCRKSQTSSVFSESASSFTPSFEASNSTANGSDVKHRTITQALGRISSLTKYRLNMLSENSTEKMSMLNDTLNSSISETSFTKPSLTDIEDDFEYRPSKRKNSSSESWTQDMHSTSERSLDKDEGPIKCLKRLKPATGLSSDMLPSPKVADVFPKHWEEQSARQWSTSEACSTKPDVNVNQSDKCQYKPHLEKSENILNEIKQLEVQDQDSHDMSQNMNMSSILPKNGKCSESVEAEFYLDSEQRLMDADIEYYMYKSHVVKQQDTEKDSSTLQSDIQASSQGSKLGEHSSFSSPVFDSEQDIGIPVSENRTSVKILKDKDTKPVIDSEQAQINSVEKLEDNSHPCLSVLNSHKSPILESHLQDPEISSGRNQHTQTESCPGVKDIQDVATSPLQLAVPNLCETGTQCDLYREMCRVPSLKQISENCMEKLSNVVNLIRSNKSTNDLMADQNEP